MYVVVISRTRFSPFTVDSRDWTQAIRFCDKCLYPLSHLAGPESSILSKLYKTKTQIQTYSSGLTKKRPITVYPPTHIHHTLLQKL